MDGTGMKLYAEDAAKAVPVSFSTWRRYSSDAGGRRRIAPPPDGTDIEKGHARPWWWESTIAEWKKHRPGPGARTDLAERAQTVEPQPDVP
jgi:hypothetical protein